MKVTEKERAKAGRGLRSGNSEAARLLNTLRKNRTAGPGVPRKKPHDPRAAYCLCVECRIKRGHYKPKYATSAA